MPYNNYNTSPFSPDTPYNATYNAPANPYNAPPSTRAGQAMPKRASAGDGETAACQACAGW